MRPVWDSIVRRRFASHPTPPRRAPFRFHRFPSRPRLIPSLLVPSRPFSSLPTHPAPPRSTPPYPIQSHPAPSHPIPIPFDVACPILAGRSMLLLTHCLDPRPHLACQGAHRRLPPGRCSTLSAMEISTMALLTMALLTMALLTMALLLWHCLLWHCLLLHCSPWHCSLWHTIYYRIYTYIHSASCSSTADY